MDGRRQCALCVEFNISGGGGGVGLSTAALLEYTGGGGRRWRIPSEDSDALFPGSSCNVVGFAGAWHESAAETSRPVNR